MSPESALADWLARLETLHPSTIELGLDRARRVKDVLGLEPRFPVIVVGGTNGKGSTCAYLEAMLMAAGYKTGLYTSPHLLRYNERVRIAGVEALDTGLVRAFERVEAARGETLLTYFEFGTLAAVQQFVAAKVEVAILEVGLGGRLDAVNVFDADVAVVTSVDIDHIEYLGDTREAIGVEKAGIFRQQRPAICVDPAPPYSLVDHAERTDTRLLRLGKDFGFVCRPDCWDYRGLHSSLAELPRPAMAGVIQCRNATGAIAALEALGDRLPVGESAIRQGLRTARVAGRFQVLSSNPEVVLDVAHNPEAARALAATLKENPVRGRTFAVVGMLADKDASGVIAALTGQIDGWLVATPDSPRAMPAATLSECIRSRPGRAPVMLFSRPEEAFAAAQEQALENDRILVFGSFYTVAAVLNHAPAQ